MESITGKRELVKVTNISRKGLINPIKKLIRKKQIIAVR